MNNQYWGHFVAGVVNMAFIMLFLSVNVHAVNKQHPNTNPTHRSNDMKTVTVKNVNQKVTEAQEVPTVLEAAGIEWNNIDNVGWPSRFPYCPDVKFQIAHNGKNILLHYLVTEQEVRAETKQDNGNVYRDACCEFFLRVHNDGPYYNIETNCIGTMLIEVGMKRGITREKASFETLNAVKRWSSLACQKEELPEGPCTWQLSLIIPASTFFKDNVSDFSGKEMTGNFYKTGDALKEPHYISWNPIHTPNPDFHKPQFLGKIIFE